MRKGRTFLSAVGIECPLGKQDWIKLLSIVVTILFLIVPRPQRRIEIWT